MTCSYGAFVRRRRFGPALPQGRKVNWDVVNPAWPSTDRDLRFSLLRSNEGQPLAFRYEGTHRSRHYSGSRHGLESAGYEDICAFGSHKNFDISFRYCARHDVFILKNENMTQATILSMQDFIIQSKNFDLTNEYNILRIMCGLFFLPHTADKITKRGLNVVVLGGFAKAGFYPPKFWVWLAFVVESVSGTALVLGLASRWAAVMACVSLMVAAYAVHRLSGGFSWIWTKGGYEFPIFWSICCAVVAMHEFRIVGL